MALAGCGQRPTGGFLPGTLTQPSLRQLLAARRRAGDATALQIFLGGQDYVSSIDNYIAFFLEHASNRQFGAKARVWLTPTADPNAALVPVGPISAPWYAYSTPDGPSPLPQGLNAFHFRFPRPGIWTMVVETAGTHFVGSTIIEGAGHGVEPAGHAETRLPGDTAIPSQTPTVDNPRGVSPICTRKPPCDMHAITLAQAVSSSKPTAFIVATPEFCQSRNCGPSLNELIAVENELRGRVNFIHAEVYLNDQATTIEQQIPSPTFKEWNLGSEPWLFLIDSSGVIAQRFEGGFTASQARAGLLPLVRT